MHSDEPNDLQGHLSPTNPRWVELVHRWRWPILVAGFIVYGFVPPDGPRWLPALVFFASILGFWIRDLVDSHYWKRSHRARDTAPNTDEPI